MVEEVSDQLHEARMHVKYIYGDGGWKPGSFTTNLIQAVMVADPINRAILRTVYPEIVQAVEEFQSGKLKLGD